VLRSWSIPVGRIFGVELRIHLTFLFLLLFIWFTESAAQKVASPGRVTALVAIIFLCVLAHELGHSLVRRQAGVPAKAIILLPIGGVTILDDTKVLGIPKQNWQHDVRVALAGPLVNITLAIVSGAWLLGLAQKTAGPALPYLSSTHLLRSFVWANIWLAAVNLLPAYPLDGGRMLRAIFSRGADPVRATRRAVSIGQTLATLLMLGCMLLYVQSGSTSYAWLVMVGFFLLLAGQMEERSAIFQSVLDNVRLEDVMLTDFATLSPADTLEDALDKAVHCLQDDFPVVRGSDMVGVISKQKILEALRAEGNGYVQAVMNRIFEVAQKKESLASAFRKLTSKNLSIIPVVEDQHLVGIVTLQNLMHSMALLAESRKLRRDNLEAL